MPTIWWRHYADDGMAPIRRRFTALSRSREITLFDHQRDRTNAKSNGNSFDIVYGDVARLALNMRNKSPVELSLER